MRLVDLQPVNPALRALRKVLRVLSPEDGERGVVVAEQEQAFVPAEPARYVCEVVTRQWMSSRQKKIQWIGETN